MGYEKRRKPGSVMGEKQIQIRLSSDPESLICTALHKTGLKDINHKNPPPSKSREGGE